MSNLTIGVSGDKYSGKRFYLYFFWLYVRVFFELKWRWQFEVCTLERPYGQDGVKLYTHVTYVGPLKYEVSQVHSPLKPSHVNWVSALDVAVFLALVGIVLLPLAVALKIFL